MAQPTKNATAVRSTVSTAVISEGGPWRRSSWTTAILRFMATRSSKTGMKIPPLQNARGMPIGDRFATITQPRRLRAVGFMPHSPPTVGTGEHERTCTAPRHASGHREPRCFVRTLSQGGGLWGMQAIRRESPR